MVEKEENAIVLDFLPYGYPLERKMIPVAQAIGTKQFTLLHLVPRRDVKLEIGETVYVGNGKRDKIYYILGRLPNAKMTETTKEQLQSFIEDYILNNEEKFLLFINTAGAINTRLHQIELLPGFGKKHTESILIERNKNPFSSIEDLKKRVSNLPDPKKSFVKRMYDEISGKEKYLLFTQPQYD
jgi:putative nucleotide binding protein